MSAGFFFNGQQYISPTVQTVVNDSGLLPPNTSTGSGLILIGASTGGAPNTPLVFGSPAALQAALGSGDLVDAGIRAFNPSKDVPGPSSITCIRVNPALQSTGVIVDGGGNQVISLASADFGQKTNAVSYAIANGSVQGLKLTASGLTGSLTKDNVYQSALTLQYAGAGATATATVTATGLTLTVAGNAPVVIPFAQFPTIQQVAAYINTVPGFTATVSPGAGPLVSVLDGLTNQDVKTAPYALTANLQAAISWFNSTGIVVATQVAGALTVPAPVPTTYLTGGSDGVITNTSWSSALTTAQSVNLNWLCALSSNPTIAAMVDAHVQYMSTVGRSERRAAVGAPLATPDATAISLAGAIGSNRTSLVHIGVYDYDLTGVLSGLVLYQPYIHAAMIWGGFAGSAPGVAMTNKGLNVQGMERNLRNPTDTDALITGGVLCTAPTLTGFKVVQSISTWRSDNKFDKVEQSCGAALDYVCRQLRAAVAPYKGGPGSPATLALEIAACDSALRFLQTPGPNGPGTIVGDANSPAYTGLSGSLSGQQTLISVQVSPVIPNNFIGITVNAVPYSGTASAS